MSFFIRPTDEYVRNIDILDVYYRDMATGLSKRFNRPYDECLAYVKSVTSDGGRLHFSDPPMKYVGRKSNGDRVLKTTTFLRYLKTVNDNQLIMSPSMTVYQSPDRDRSIPALYINQNVKKRNKSKKEMFAAREANNVELAEYKNNEQQSNKIKNNALSGAAVSNSTPLFKHTIHSSLTSTCRTASGFGNANNEKVLAGNRHYWSPSIVEANILRTINLFDRSLMETVLSKYSLRTPTVDEVMLCIKRSSDPYWRDDIRLADIRRLVESLDPVELAGFMYTGDFYHLTMCNEDVIRHMLKNLSLVINDQIENPKTYVTTLTEEAAALVSLLCGKYMGGKSINAFDSFSAETQNIIGATAKNIAETLMGYQDLIKVIFVSDVIPASLAHLPTIYRRVAVTSDTDSTIFTVQDWLKWYSGSISFEPEVVNVGHVIAFLTSSSITHILAIMSANMGVAKKQLHQYAMKSEYYFPVFALTSRAKTYFAHMGAQEGQVFTEPELEIKGAVLKGSTIPKHIVDEAKRLIEQILNTISNDKKIELYPILNRVAMMEKEIYDSINRGETNYYKTGEIKSADSYKLSESRSPYFQYMLWEEVFAPKYGHIQPPPYAAIKVNVSADNPTEFKAWMDSFEDQGLRERFIQFLHKTNKTSLSTFWVPKPIAEANGIPIEIIQGVSIRKIISNLMEPMYVILESLGYFTLDKKQLRLVSDEYITPAE